MQPLSAWPQILFGTTPLGNIYRIVPEADKRELVAAWFRHAGRPVFVDSAGKYGAGLALESLGRHLAGLGVAPEEVVISNKLGWKRVPLETPEPTFEPGAWFGLEHDAEQRIGYEGILECHEEGNALLAPYEARLVSVHDPDEYLAAADSAADGERRFRDILEAYRALAELKRSGRADAVGVGAKDWTAIRRIHEAGVELDWVMLANSWTAMRHPPELRRFMEELERRGVAIFNSAVFHGGFLTGGEFFDYRKVDRQTDPELFAWRDRFEAVCAEFGTKPAFAAAAYAREAPGVVALALSTSRPDRVGEMVALAGAELGEGLRRALVEAGLV
jgi:D-threo-aldose 1-dehydrogenase